MVSNCVPSVRSSRLATAWPTTVWASTQREVDRLFEQVFDSLRAGGNSAPPLGVWEDAAGLHFEFDLPGVTSEQIEVSILEGQLRVKAERPAPTAERKVLVNQRAYGHFERVIALPEAYDPQSLEAELSHGVLHLKLAKRPEVQPRKVEIKTG